MKGLIKIVKPEYVREGILIKTPKLNYLVVEFNNYIEGIFYEYMLVSQDTFTVVGYYKDKQDIVDNYEIIEFVYATIEEVFIS